MTKKLTPTAHKILVIGPSNAGKTTFLGDFKEEKIENTTATIGYNHATVEDTKRNIKWYFNEVGGDERFDFCIKTTFSTVDYVIILIDDQTEPDIAVKRINQYFEIFKTTPKKSKASSSSLESMDLSGSEQSDELNIGLLINRKNSENCKSATTLINTILNAFQSTEILNEALIESDPFKAFSTKPFSFVSTFSVKDENYRARLLDRLAQSIDLAPKLRQHPSDPLPQPSWGSWLYNQSAKAVENAVFYASPTSWARKNKTSTEVETEADELTQKTPPKSPR